MYNFINLLLMLCLFCILVLAANKTSYPTEAVDNGERSLLVAIDKPKKPRDDSSCNNEEVFFVSCLQSFETNNKSLYVTGRNVVI